ncbi:MAG: hypothetical protein GF355_08220 [Candidatus Eisenbacteria bacterium]|nr:hypothetical protein [Candidatus Eisenbacteria bacterium]
MSSIWRPRWAGWTAGIVLGLALLIPGAWGQDLLFEEFSLSAAGFSPNDDGVQDSVVVRVQLKEAARLWVRVEAQNELVRTLLDSAAVGTDPLSLVWSGRAEPDTLDPGPITEGSYAVKARAWTESQTDVAESLEVSIDLTPPVHASTALVAPDTNVVRDGETLILETTWDGEGYAIRADFTALDSDTLGGLQSSVSDGETTRLTYIISTFNTVADADSIPIPITAVDRAGNSAVDSSFVVHLHNAPIPLGTTVVSPTGGVQNGDTITIRSLWDRSGYILTADFCNLDSGCHEVDDFEDVGEGEYKIWYTVSSDNTVMDDSIAVPVTATSRFGDSFTDSSFHVCLSNHPPVFLGAELRSDRTVFRNTDTLQVETRWRSPAGLAVIPGADFQGVSTRYTPGKETYQVVDDTTYVVTYVLPATNEAPDAASVAIPLHAADGGCGFTRGDTLWVGLDNTPPEVIPVLDPTIPTAVVEPRLEVSGLAPGVPRVAVYINETRAAVTDVDGEGSFGVEVSLMEGTQEISAAGRDFAGNESERSASLSVTYVTGSRLEIPKPFRDGDAIVAEDPRGWERVRATILNLEGGLVRRWNLQNPGRRVELVWDGRNGESERVHSGPFLVRWEAWSLDGRRDEQVHALIYLRGGGLDEPVQ